MLIVAAAQENYFTEWRSHQREYRQILLSKAETESEVKGARAFSIEIRQVVLPDRGSVDRCISCHLGTDDPRMIDVEQPYAAHPDPYLQDHEIDRFGCTVCHQGQGQATVKEDAHAVANGVFWELPLLPARLSQSVCGTCHDPVYLGDRGGSLLAAGLDAFRSQGCLGCHKLGGRGGPMGPALDHVGDKGRHAYSFAHLEEGPQQVWTWHRAHLRAPSEIVPESMMPPVMLDDDGIDALTAYLMSLRTTNLTERLTPMDRYVHRYRIWHTEPYSGEELYEQFCLACHEDGTETLFHDSLDVTIPAIRHPDFLAVASTEFLVENMLLGREGTPMTAWGEGGGGLTRDELGRIAEYLLEARQEVVMPDFTLAEDADRENGARIFQDECTDCHSLDAAGSDAPWLGSAGFQQTYSDALMGHTIKHGRTDTLMMGYGENVDGDLTDQDISDLVKYIRTLQ